MAQLGERIKKIRKFANVSQEVFANSLGVSRGHISNLETGAAVPSEQLIKSICREWEIREEWLQEGKQPESEKPPLKPEVIQGLYQQFEEINYKSFKGYLELILSQLDQIIKGFSRFSKKLDIQTCAKIAAKEKDVMLKLQKELSIKLDKIKWHALRSDNLDVERSVISILRAIDNDSLKDFYLFLASKGDRLEEQKKMKLKKDISALKRAAK